MGTIRPGKHRSKETLRIAISPQRTCNRTNTETTTEATIKAFNSRDSGERSAPWPSALESKRFQISFFNKHRTVFFEESEVAVCSSLDDLMII
jgi:hypothetical protein